MSAKTHTFKAYLIKDTGAARLLSKEMLDRPTNEKHWCPVSMIQYMKKAPPALPHLPPEVKVTIPEFFARRKGFISW